MEDYLTVHEAAAMLGYTIDYVRRLSRAGTIRAPQFNRVWMIPRAEVERIKAMQGKGGRLPKGTFSKADTGRR